MRILALWVVKYYSGSTSERFVNPLEALGCKIDVIPLEDGNIEEKLIKAIRHKSYDMLLHVPYPNKVRLEVIRNLPIKKIAWCGDDEWYWTIHPKFAQDIADSHDYCITTFSPALLKYKNGVLGSWGYSDIWKPKKTKKDIDIYFCGSKTDIRDQYLGALVNAGFNIEIDGPGYSGKIPLETMIDNYRRSKIGLSFVSESKGDFHYEMIKARTFEIPAVGTFQLSENCTEIHSYFKERKEIVTFSDLKSLTEKCKYYLEHDLDREQIAKSGHLRNKNNSYTEMFKRVFKQIEQKESHA